jgi:hypothetical protein
MKVSTIYISAEYERANVCHDIISFREQSITRERLDNIISVPSA